MRLVSLALQGFARDWRAGELRLIAAAIVVAITSLTSVGYFTDRVRRATESQATELLAADLVLQSRQPIAEEVVDLAESAGLAAVNVTSLNSMVVSGDELQMAEIKAVGDGYPLRGALRTADSLFGGEAVTAEIPRPGTAWVDSRLYQLLELETGDTVQVGSAEVIVARVLTYEPDRGGDMFNIAPRLMMNLKDLPSTDLILPASRVEYSLLLGGGADAITAFRDEVEEMDDLRVQGIRDARPELRSALERAEQFLGLAALVSVALAGLAVGMSAQRYAVRHFDHCAIMRCLGAEQGLITGIYAGQLLILSLLAGLAGCALGYLAQEVLARLLAGMTSASLPPPSFTPLVTGMAAAVVTVMGFAVPQIWRLRAVPPLRVLRRDLNPLPLHGAAAYGAAVIALALLTPWQTGNASLTAYALAGILASIALLTGGAALMIRGLNRFRGRAGVAWRFGLANIARRSSLSIAQILGIGLGVMVMLLLTLVRTDLLDGWRGRLPEGTPNYFLINIQEQDVPELKRFLEQDQDTAVQLFPMIRARLTAINGQAVDPDAYPDGEGRRWARRGYNLTWSDELPAANVITRGKWWSGTGPHPPQFSLDEEIPPELGVGIGDTLTFLVAGQEISGRISNTRRIDWDSFNVNFFVVANPAALEGAPASYVTSFHLPDGRKGVLVELVRKFPSVTVIDVDALITEVRRIMDQVIRTVEFVFVFTLLAGFIVLAAALQTTHDERAYEAALLTTLGAGRRQVLASLATEFTCIGLIAGVLAALSATAVELLLARYVFNMEINPDFRLWLIAPPVCAAVIVAGGLAGTRGALRAPPAATLRQS